MPAVHENLTVLDRVDFVFEDLLVAVDPGAHRDVEKGSDFQQIQSRLHHFSIVILRSWAEVG